jgi:small subunit ribosomal protein S5
MKAENDLEEVKAAAPLNGEDVKKEEAEAEPEVIVPVEEEVAAVIEPVEPTQLDMWKPRTSLGRAVKTKEITDMGELLGTGQRIMESEIVDILLPNLESDLMMIGQAKGKFGGGQRRIFKQTQKKTAEGNVPSFTTMAVVGNKNGFVGLGMAGSKETVPARNKAIRLAKLNIIKIRRSCGSWECGCGNPHSIPFRVTGKCGSVKITLMPAPKGTGLCVEKECKKLLGLAGIKDVWSTTYGNTTTKVNLIAACFAALKVLGKFKVPDKTEMNIVDGALPEVKNVTG